MNGRSEEATVKKDEVDKFATINDWWDPQARSARGLHSMNQLRVPLIKDALLKRPLASHHDEVATPLEGYTVLDVGCGAGLLCEPLARLGARVKGIDPVANSISVARDHASLDPVLSGRLTYECCTMEDLLTAHEQYDAVVASEVVEHVADVGLFIKQQCQLVKPGGVAVLTTINRTLTSYALAIVMAEYVLGLLPRGTHTWSMFCTPEELAGHLAATGMKVDQVRGMSYNPLNNQWSWGYQWVNYAIQARKPVLSSWV
ncbi:hypothetical protein EMCRGX_G034388 [Ephydatia muelleri]|eukprot:Em0023g322a